jgi:hypothetical protein
MRYKNEFTIYSTTQLIDINKGVTNFKANLSITAQNDNDEFNLVIVTQKDLDNVDFELNYRTITNYVNVDVESNENVHDDYVLIIRSDKKIKVTIVIDLDDLDKTPIPPPQQQLLPPPPQQQQLPPPPQQQQQPPPQQQNPNNFPNPQYVPGENFQQDNTDTSSPNYLLYIGIGILGLLLIYYLFFYKSSKQNNNKQQFKTIADVIVNSDVTAEVKSVEPVIKDSDVGNNDLLSKLRELRS